MSDISKRLRDGWKPGYAPVGLMSETADYIERLEDAIRPFHAAVFNDNGDITISTGHITLGDWLKLARVMRNQE